MYTSLDISSLFPFSIAVRFPQVRLVPQSASDLAFVAFLLLSLASALRVLRYYISVRSPVDTAFATTLATGKLDDSGDEPIAPLSPSPPSLATSLVGLISSIGTMIVSPFAVRPVPVTQPPSNLVEIELDVIPKLDKPESPVPVKQPYDSFLVLDVEATCQEGTDFNWPNEIIVSEPAICCRALL